MTCQQTFDNFILTKRLADLSVKTISNYEQFVSPFIDCLGTDRDLESVTQEDIVENPYNIQFTEMNSMTIPATMADFDYVAITGSVVYNAGIDASTALANEDIQDYLVLQVVVKEENKDADWAKAIVNAYHSDEFKKYMEENNDGLWWIPKELQ